MRIKITDVVTSMKMLKDAEKGKHLIYLGCDLKSKENGSRYGWAFRVHQHTAEEIAAGKEENPQVVTMPMEEFCEKIGVTIEPEDIGKTFVAFPQKNEISFFTDYCPAYEVLPDGVTGYLVEVEIE
jgi:hypothetical protein